MGTPRSLVHDVAATASWYGKQVRCAAGDVAEPIRRVARLVLDDAGSSLIELAATGEDIRVGLPAPALRTIRRSWSTNLPSGPVMITAHGLQPTAHG